MAGALTPAQIQAQLSIAASRGHAGVVAGLLELGANPAGGGPGLPALAWAASRDHVAVISLLLEAGATVDLDCGDGYTALHHACEEGAVGAAGALLARGASGDR